MQQRNQLIILNEFKELVLARQIDSAIAVLGRRPQVISVYAFEAQALLITSIATTGSFRYIQTHTTVSLLLQQLPCFNALDWRLYGL